MPISLSRAVEIAYRGAGIGYALASTKHDLALAERNQTRIDRNDEPKGTPAKVDLNWYYHFWWNMAVACRYAMDYFGPGLSNDQSLSLRYRLEGLYTDLGNNVVDLPDWNYFSGLDIAVALTFTEVPPASYETNQSSFTANGDEVYNPLQPIRQRSETFLDALTEDLWKEEAMRRWLDSEVIRTGESPGDLAEWDSIQSGSGDFFGWSNRCEVRMVDQLKGQANPGIGPPDHAASVAKWQYKDTGPPPQRNDLIAAGGLYALNTSQVSGVWNSRLESLPANVRY